VTGGRAAGAGREAAGAADRDPVCAPTRGCVTCADVAVWMRVLDVAEDESLALCLDEQHRRVTVDTGIVGVVAPGEILLVHAGTALIREPA